MCITGVFFCNAFYFLFGLARSLKRRRPTLQWPVRSDDEDEDDDAGRCDSPPARTLSPASTTPSAKRLSIDAAPAHQQTQHGADRHLMADARRGSRASRASSGMIEMVEEALGGAVLVPGHYSHDGRAGTGNSGGRDALYRKWQTLVYNFLERPRGSKAISYHVFV